jgi:hypothetical protein
VIFVIFLLGKKQEYDEYKKIDARLEYQERFWMLFPQMQLFNNWYLVYFFLITILKNLEARKREEDL